MYSIVSSANSDSFIFYFQLNSFYSFFLIVVPRIYSATLNKNGERGHPCIVPDLRWNAYSFSPLSMMLVVGLSYIAFIIFLLCLLCWEVFFFFNHKWMFNFVKSFICICWDDYLVKFLVFNLLMWHITLIDLQILNHPCLPGDKSQLIIVYGPFNVLVNSVC